MYISVAWSSSMWLQAQHLHTSAERRESPVASLSSPELLSDLFTCSPHAAQAKRMRGIMGEKRMTNAGKEQEEEEGAVEVEEEEGASFWTGEERQRRVKRGNKQEKSVQALITCW